MKSRDPVFRRKVRALEAKRDALIEKKEKLSSEMAKTKAELSVMRKRA